MLQSGPRMMCRQRLRMSPGLKSLVALRNGNVLEGDDPILRLNQIGVRIETGIEKSDGDSFAGVLTISAQSERRRDHGKPGLRV